MSYGNGNYTQGIIDNENNAYSLLITGQGYQSAGISMGGDTNLTYGFKMSTDATHNAYMDLRGDLNNAMTFRYKDNTSSQVTPLMDLMNDATLTGDGFGATIHGRVNASSYYIGQVDTRAPKLPGVYMSTDGDVGKFSINKGTGKGGFNFSTFDSNGILIMNNLNLLAEGTIRAPFYDITENPDDSEAVAVLGVDSSGNLTRYFDINARLRALEERTTDIELSLEDGVDNVVNDVVGAVNTLGFSTGAVPALPKFNPKAAPKVYIPLMGVDYPGNDISSFKEATQASCQSICTTNPNCTASVMDNSTNVCYLKSKLSITPILNPNRTTYVLKGNGTAIGVTYGGHDINVVTSTGYEDCRSKCQVTTGCIAGEYNEMAKLCYLKTYLTATSLSSDIVVT